MFRDMWSHTYVRVLLFVIILLVLITAVLVMELLRQRARFKRYRRYAARKSDQVSNLQTSIALSQIRPHFLYNALNSIYVLCGKDLRKGRQAISDLADYLRINLSSIDSKEPIPFEKEMEHVRTYMAIEQMRFPDEFTVSYSTPVTDFCLPALTIQPLAENAVRHGVVPKGGDGIIIIATRETHSDYVITITDNGEGYDTDDAEANDPEKHVGIRNVRERLMSLVGGELEIQSTIGYGTEAIIRIPKVL